MTIYNNGRFVNGDVLLK